MNYSINRNFAYRGLSGLGNGLNCHLEFGENCVVNLLHPLRFLESEISFSGRKKLVKEEQSIFVVKTECRIFLPDT